MVGRMLNYKLYFPKQIVVWILRKRPEQIVRYILDYIAQRFPVIKITRNQLLPLAFIIGGSFAGPVIIWPIGGLVDIIQTILKDIVLAIPDVVKKLVE